MSEIENVYQYINSTLTDEERYCMDIPYYHTKETIFKQVANTKEGELDLLIRKYADHARGKSLVENPKNAIASQNIKYQYSLKINRPFSNISLEGIIDENGLFHYCYKEKHTKI